MAPFTILTLYPLWATSLLVGVTALRLGRRASVGLVSLCFALALWVTGLVLFEHPATREVAEHVLPGGMILAAGFTHAGFDLMRPVRRGGLYVAYAFSLAVAALGAVSPELLLLPGLTGAGPLLWPVATVAGMGLLVMLGWLLRGAMAARGADRKRRWALWLGSIAGTAGGGVAVMAHVLRWYDVRFATLPLFAAVLLVAYALLSGEVGRSAALVRQGIVYAALTAAVSAVGLTFFFTLLPHLLPHPAAPFAWMVFVVFFAALPLDPLRSLLVEHIGRRLFTEPMDVRDLTDRVEAIEVRADQAERLAEIGAVVGGVAHEIRNPLGIIAVQAKLLERAGANAESVAALREQVARAKRFLDDLLLYGKPRPLALDRVDVESALRRAIDRARGPIDDAPEVSLDAPVDVYLEVDPNAFEDVHTALVHNAIAALADGGGGPLGGRIAVRASVDADFVTVTVDDDGPGIPSAIASRIFAPFVTGRGRDAKHPGTGLGLAIAARWVERHGGTLDHEPRAGGGARFVARWPLQSNKTG